MTNDCTQIRPQIPADTWERLSAFDKVQLVRCGCDPPNEPQAEQEATSAEQDEQDLQAELPTLEPTPPTPG